MSSMKDFQCWFCGDGIDRSDAGAVMMNIENLWGWAEGTRGADAPLQSIYANSQCTKGRMTGATMTLEPSIFGDED